MHITSQKRQSEKATYYMILNLWHSGKGHIGEVAKNPCLPGVGQGEGVVRRGKGGMDIKITEDFKSVKLECKIL